MAGAEAAEVGSQTLTRQEFESKLRQLIHQAENGGMSGQEIIETLRQELEFTAECVDPHFRYTVQVINLGHDDSMGGPDAKAEDFREKWARNKFTKP